MKPLACPISELDNFKCRYRDYVSETVRRKVLQFHSRTLFGVPESMETTYFCRVPTEVIELAEQRETFLQPVYAQAVEIPSQENYRPLRDRSATVFHLPARVSVEPLYQVIRESLLAFQGADGRWHRPYPSAGALYPVEVLLTILLPPEDSMTLSQGLYHVLPHSARLARLDLPKDRPFDPRHWRPDDFGEPVFCLTYFLNLDRAIFKYRYRGYRHALMEVGALYQAGACAAIRAGLRSRSWSGFSDDVLSADSGLHPAELLPVLVQCFGWEEAS